MDGKGSDEIYFGEDFRADKDDDIGSIRLRVPKLGKNGADDKSRSMEYGKDSSKNKVEPLSIFDEEMPPTSRNLLNEDAAGSDM